MPEVITGGKYIVYAWYPSDKKNAEHVPVKISHTRGESIIYINQHKDGGKWSLLGEWLLDKGNKNSVIISSENTKGIVVPDAIRFALMSQ